MTEAGEGRTELPQGTHRKLAGHLGQVAAAGGVESSFTKMGHPWNSEEVLANETRRGGIYGTGRDGPAPTGVEQTSNSDIF